MSVALLRSSFDEAIALHRQVKDADPRPPLDAAAAIVAAVGQVAAIHVNVRSAVTARVQEVHRTLLHVICDIVEKSVVDR